jgi:hypothetical protein
VSELRAGSCIKDPFLFFDTGVSRLGFGEEVLSSYLGSFKVYQTGFVTVELHAGIKDLRRGTLLWPVQDVYTRVRFRFAVCMILFFARVWFSQTSERISIAYPSQSSQCYARVYRTVGRGMCKKCFLGME